MFFVDKHAKIAANTFRPLPSDVRLVRDEAASVTDIARWVGLATERANHHPPPGMQPPGAKHVHVRDSQAVRPVSSAVVRKAKQAAVVDAVPAVVASVGPVVVSGTHASGLAPRGSPLLVSSGEAVRRNAAATQGRAAVRAFQDGDELRLRDWLESRPATSLPLCSASQRVQAMRDRLRDKLRSCGCRVLSPQCECA